MKYSPLYFLSALGSGGLAVTFFLWLLFWIPHPGQPIPVFEDWTAAFSNGSIATQGMIVLALAGIVYFAFNHFRLLIWNFRECGAFRKTEDYANLAESDAQVQRLAAPLATSMSVNVALILGAMFVPGLWTVVEYLFPLAMIAFLAVGTWAFKLYGELFVRAMSGKFNMDANGSFAQVLPAFTFVMVGVGLAAPAAMSTTPAIVGTAIVLSSVFLAAGLFITVIKTISGFHQMFSKGIGEAALPTLWILVPIITIVSIALMRIDHGVAHTLHDADASSWLLFLSLMVGLQTFVLFLGYRAMALFDYMPRMFAGEVKVPGAFSLICPGVAYSVLFQFFINKGLVAAGVITKFGLAYGILTVVPLALTAVTIVLYLRLNRTLGAGTPLATA